MENRKTKIVCSIGPSSTDDNVVRNLILAGMNVARLNFSHGSHDYHKDSIQRVRRISKELGIPVAILLDTKGPEIRTGIVENDGKVIINKGDSVMVTVDGCVTSAAQGQTPARISISWKDAVIKIQGLLASRSQSNNSQTDSASCGKVSGAFDSSGSIHILVADGLLDLEVISVSDGVINCKANNTAEIGSKKNVNLIGIHAGLPILSEQDKKDIEFGVKMDVDFIAASFVSFPHEVTEIKKYLDSFKSPIKVIAKIECADGVENIKEIAKLADGVMVARGDLGVQLPVEQIPIVQKYIISVCRKAGKPVITATQMLESMIVNPRPTRAELTDVANAIFDGTDAVMLSGETTIGAYPVEAVKIMDKIACTAEQSDDFKKHMKSIRDECFSADNFHDNIDIIVSRSGAEISSKVNAKAIVTPTLSGNTARILSVFRPDHPVLAMTPNERAIRVMQLYWGIYPHYAPIADESASMIRNSIKIASENGVEVSDKIVLVAGLPLHTPIMVNTVRIIKMGTI